MSKAERTAALRLEHISDAIRRMRTYVADLDFEGFRQSQIRFDAVAMNVLVIGESVAHLPPRLQAMFEDAKWAKIVAVRNLIAHGYPDLDAEIMWDIATNHINDLEAMLPVLRAALEES